MLAVGFALVVAACTGGSSGVVLDASWRAATVDRLTPLVVEAEPFPAVLAPFPEEMAESYTPTVALSVMLAAGDELPAGSDEWVLGFWDAETGMFDDSGPPAEVMSYFAALVLTRFGERPLDPEIAGRILDNAAQRMWQVAADGTPLSEQQEDYSWVRDVVYWSWLVDLIATSTDDPALERRARTLLEEALDDWNEPASRATAQPPQHGTGLLLVDRLAQDVVVTEHDRVGGQDGQALIRGDSKRLRPSEPLGCGRAVLSGQQRLVDVRRPHGERDAQLLKDAGAAGRGRGQNEERRPRSGLSHHGRR